jgi:acetyl-CoA synthetase/medium-chain acyl-CoA synthetase
VSRPAITTLEGYRRIRERYELTVPERFNFGRDVLDGWAAKRPDGCALWWVGAGGQERKLTFRELAETSDRVASALRTLGLERGDRVLVNLPSVPEWWQSMVGLTKADMVAIPATTMLTEKDIAFRVESARIDAILTDAAGAAKVDRVAASLPDLRVKVQVGGPPRSGWFDYEDVLAAVTLDGERIETDADGAALIYFTSGTTGPPKMVLHTHASYGIGHRLTADFWLDLAPGRVHWNMSDTGWAKTAYAGYFGPWIHGACVFVSHHPGKFDPVHTLDVLSHYPIESLCAPPTVYRMLIQEDLAAFRPMALRQCRAAGEALNVEVLERWREATGITIREGYGQSETVLLCASIPDLPVKPGSMGLPLPGFDVAVVDAEGNPLPAGQPGEIAVRVEPERPVGLFREYWHAPEATSKCYHGDWYLTGDLAHIDDDGYFWFVARSDDIITSSAYRIGPFEVENALMEHPAVAECAVVGKPDPERTEVVKAFVVLATGYRASEELKQELQQHTKQSTAPYKYPREIEFLDELPKTVSGKIRRVELKARASAGPPPS